MDETRYLGVFAYKERAFWLPMPRVIAAEREMGVAIGQLYVDLAQNVGLIGEHPILMSPLPARLQHCHHLIRNALIGGGETEEAAAELVRVYCYPARPAIRDFELAYRILNAAIQGVEPQKKTAPPGRRGRSAKAG